MKSSSGFTLIEVIAIITIVAVSAALFASYMGTAVTQSPASAILVNKQYQLIQQMEIINSRYRNELQKKYENGQTLDLCAFKTTYVDNLKIDGKSIVDATNTSCSRILTLTGGTDTYTTQNVLLVTLTDGQQTVQSIFTN